MRRQSILISVLVALQLVPSLQAEQFARGHLLIVGGGDTPLEARREALDLAGGVEAQVVVLPYARDTDSRGVKSVSLWKKVGARNVINTSKMEPPHVARAIRAAALIWMPGGNQSRLMGSLAEMGVVELLRSRYQDGIVVGGSSAGAAVMSRIMITQNQEEDALGAQTTPTAKGLGLLPGTIVDQHFVKRDRYNRFLSAILDRPWLLGIGISEDTAIMVYPDGALKSWAPVASF